jgi:ATP-dependent Clp protease protease subunit
MAAVLLTSGEPGMRYALPHSRILLHQPMGGVQGQVTDVAIQAREMQRMKDELNRIISHHTGQAIEKVVLDTDRDYFMTPQDAKEYGILDNIIAKRQLTVEGGKADAKDK